MGISTLDRLKNGFDSDAELFMPLFDLNSQQVENVFITTSRVCWDLLLVPGVAGAGVISHQYFVWSVQRRFSFACLSIVS